MKLANTCRDYARLFVEHLQNLHADEGVTDIWNNFDVTQELAQRAFEDVGMVSTPDDGALNAGGALLQRLTSTFDHIHDLVT
eukprot:CAMPEP_0195138146 /NCGR_PEP_ID=MMETSP0448-20130528/157236_1 /TAXON_ID=66468 /ORGANISM="Heterocapsa triquestra, Strain CCMP 448" /LENGTH=81 /DNA_ID=CAMNT_0040176403 /DNA_START=33 /DNA_END=274 /DNA_ORIENTATION=-